jgi:hypothetical protein
VPLIVSTAIDSNGDLLELDELGILTKTTAGPSVAWSVDISVQVTPGNFVFPNMIAIDINDDIWAVYDGQLDTKVFNNATGAEDFAIAGTAADAIVITKDNDYGLAYDSATGQLYRIRGIDKVLDYTFDLPTMLASYEAPQYYVSSLASGLNDLAFIPAFINGGLCLVEIDYIDKTASLYDIGTANPPAAAIADNNDHVWIVDILGSIIRWDQIQKEVEQVFFTIDPGLLGHPQILTITDAGDLYLQDDGSYGNAGCRIQYIDAVTGEVVLVSDGLFVGPITGDALGYHLNKIVRVNVAPTPVTPVVDNSKLTATGTPAGVVSITGLPGAIDDADVVEVLDNALSVVATPTLNADGSFSWKSSSGTGSPTAGDNYTVRAKNTTWTTQADQLKTTVLRDLGTFTPEFITGTEIPANEPTRVKIGLRDGSNNPITAVSLFYLKVKNDQTGQFWNGSSYVADDGDYLALTHDVGDQSYIELTIPTEGQVSIYLDEPEFGQQFVAIDGFVVSDIDFGTISNQLDMVQSDLDDLTNDPSSVWLSSAAKMLSAGTIGNFITNKLDRVLSLSNVILSKVIPPQDIYVEDIVASILPVEVKKGTTPNIVIRVLDKTTRQPRDLNGATVTFLAGAFPGGTPIVINKEATVSSTEAGLCGVAELQLDTADTSQVGEYIAEIVVVFAGGTVLKAGGMIFSIAETLSD